MLMCAHFDESSRTIGLGINALERGYVAGIIQELIRAFAVAAEGVPGEDEDEVELQTELQKACTHTYTPLRYCVGNVLALYGRLFSTTVIIEGWMWINLCTRVCVLADACSVHDPAFLLVCALYIDDSYRVDLRSC